MLVNKTIQLEFADSGIKAIDHIQDIRDAVSNAELNLYSRYNVRIGVPMPTADNKVVVEIRIPEDIVGTFAIGNHLRGVSNYLLTRYRGRYQKYLVGKRLLNYIELSYVDQETPGFSMTDRLEAIVAFSKLLERSDDEALDQISRILVILNETENS
ncbi:MAG: hypothetical protein IKE18_08935 [Oscillospiraceae bacterium]|nr:hypothetical protein [Oscillospiraceae bacterium]